MKKEIKPKTSVLLAAAVFGGVLLAAEKPCACAMRVEEPPEAAPEFAEPVANERKETFVEEVVRQVAASDAAIEADQARLKDRISLTCYRALVRTSRGKAVWTDALQKALNEHEIVVIPASNKPYWIDGSIIVPSNRRIEAKGATVALLAGRNMLMLRNRNVADGTLAPIATGRRDLNIAVVGGCWADWRQSAAGWTGKVRSGCYDQKCVARGRFLGVTALFHFSNCDRVTVRDVTFRSASSFALQTGDGDGRLFERIRLENCFLDGVHLNGNLTRVHVRDVRGRTGDDMVALNAADWEACSVNFGPQRWILCEDIEQLPKVRGGAPSFRTPGYPAIRIHPAKYRYADGSVVDCSVRDVVFRRIRGVTTFKMYLQLPFWGDAAAYRRQYGVGTGGNLYFEDVRIDLDYPIDTQSCYMKSDPARGHFGAFEIGSNLESVTLRNIDITFHRDRFPLSHLVCVGPKVYDPWVSCTVGELTLENVTCRGDKLPDGLVRVTTFDNINGDGKSSGRGAVERITRR